MEPHYHYYPTFAGYPVLEWSPDAAAPENPAETAVAIRMDWEEREADKTWVDKFITFVTRDYAHEIPALVIGCWDYERADGIAEVVAVVAANRDALPNLKGLFVGEITQEEQEISWIQQGDLSALLNAFPNLEHLAIRGGQGLRLGDIEMPHLKSLRIETGGLDRAVVQSVGAARLPELESLVLWLGTREYGATTTTADLQDFYECKGMPRLKYLGLCDSEIADDIAAYIATAPVLQRIDVLDLSMGILTDTGALALLTSPYIRHLKKLDLHHHYCTTAMMDKLRELHQVGVVVDVSEQQRPEGNWRFVAVSE